MNKLIILTAPSGAGKTTVARHLLKTFDSLAFSVSATTRARRAHEVEGRDYYFISIKKFKKLIATDAFVEWEEVYEDQFYGTLRSEIERLWALGKHIIFDIDVEGALNIKKQYPEQTLIIFVQPPSAEILFERLRERSTEDESSLRKRIAKATKELTYANKCDVILVNDILEEALQKAEAIVSEFLSKS
ncbi:MAG: guanylate kinase [Saprospiraceae bacterium]|nr:guanylate kinase [Saprospiraceae bacterium]